MTTLENSHVMRTTAVILLNLTLAYAVLFLILVTKMAFSEEIAIPNNWDPNERFTKPITTKSANINFITTTDFPPFSFIGGEKQITGFHLDLARAICAELGILSACQIQALPWQEHEAAMKQDKNSVLISGLAIDQTSRKKYRYTRSYLTLPARFIGRKTNIIREPLFRSLSGKTIGVVEGTSHEAFLISNFKKSKLLIFADQKLAYSALINKEIEVLLSNALQGSFWLHSKQSNNCCKFVGGPYLSNNYFGHGLAIAVNVENKELLNTLNFALKAINDKGILSELYLRYFPVSLF